MIEMVHNSHYESKNNFPLLKRIVLMEKIWPVKKKSFSGKKMFFQKRFLVSECILKLVCFCESCKESELGTCFT